MTSALAMIAAAAAGCGPDVSSANGTSDPTASTAVREKTQSVTLVEVGGFERGEIRDNIPASTDIESDLRVDVYAKVGPAYIKEVRVEEGDAVKAGQPLLLLNDVDFEIEKRRRDSIWRQRQQSQLQSDAMLKESAARVRAQTAQFAKAEADLKRAVDAQDSGVDVFSEKELEDAQREFERQKAELEALDLGVERSRTEVELAKTMVEMAKIELESAEKDLKDTVVLAPCDGIIQRRDVNPGLLVSSSTHLFTLVDPTRLRAYVPISQQRFAVVSRIGLPVEFAFDSFPDRTFAGHVEAINPSVDPASGTIRVRVRLHEEAIGLVRPGMFAKVQILVESRKDAVLLSKRAVVHEAGKSYLFSFEDGIARRHALQAGAGTANEIEVLTVDGKEPDLAMKVILVGQDRLRDGDPVALAVDAETR